METPGWGDVRWMPKADIFGETWKRSSHITNIWWSLGGQAFTPLRIGPDWTPLHPKEDYENLDKCSDKVLWSDDAISKLGDFVLNLLAN